MPALSPRASRSAWPSAIEVSSTVWWASTSRSPRVRTVRSKPPCLPSWESMWSKNGTPVSTSLVPDPSRASSTWTSDSLVVRVTVAVLSTSSASLVRRRIPQPLAQRIQERRRLDLGARRHPQPPADPDVPHEHTAVQQALPRRRLVAELTEQHEVRVRVHHLEPERADRVH